MQAAIKVKFVDFWEEFYSDNFLLRLLQQHFPVVESDDPEVLIYSVYSGHHVDYTCTKIFYTAENVLPDYRYCDYSIGFNYDDDNCRHLRYPLFLFYGDIHELVRKSTISLEDVQHKNRFCSFVVSNAQAKNRIDFFHALHKVKQVDSAGRAFNNMPGGWCIPFRGKIDFLKNYRFNIAFENSASPGYTTEKIFEPMKALAIPIYWGDPLIFRDFNRRSFIHVRDFTDNDAVIRYVMELENNPMLYLEKLNEPFLPANKVPARLEVDTLLIFFEKIFYKDKVQPVSRSTVFPFHRAQFKAKRIINKVAYRLKLHFSL
jgi:alpha(1,3/1,4) fucosyltransferase